MKTFRLVILIIFLLASCFSAYQVHSFERQKIKLKHDLIELSKIKYGLFNVDEWKIIVAEIISKKIEAFKLDDSNKEAMRVKISGFLEESINDLEARYYDQKMRSITGIIQSGVAAITGTFGKIREDIPIFTEQILDFLDEEENREAIKEYLVEQLNAYTDKTFSQTDYSSVNEILDRYQQENVDTSKKYLQYEILKKNSDAKPLKAIFIVTGIVLVFFYIFSKEISKYELLLTLIISLTFLLPGVLLPMIEIDARISEMALTMLGEEIRFENQVLYYKSKSILEVVELLIFQKRVDLIFVGILVLAFSVLFPVTKLICSSIYLFNPDTKKNSFISFMVFRSGKWSMADVMVIAIFMAYIGFDGIISEQLRQLEDIAQEMDLLSTNKSNLLFGFFAFTLFVILGLFISQKIQKQLKSIHSNG